jgi:sua5/yciO/yrdC/ywlC family protein
VGVILLWYNHLVITKNLLDTAVIEALRADKLVVAPTDTIYGLLARADSPRAVDELYRVRQRDRTKSCIILLSSADNIPELTTKQRHIYDQLRHERPTTIAARVSPDFMPHLVRTDATLAFRAVPPDTALSELIQLVGPLLAPSANPGEQLPATTVNEATAYFGDEVAVYVDSGEIKGVMPSRIIKFTDEGQLVALRQ